MDSFTAGRGGYKWCKMHSFTAGRGGFWRAVGGRSCVPCRSGPSQGVHGGGWTGVSWPAAGQLAHPAWGRQTVPHGSFWYFSCYYTISCVNIVLKHT